MDERLSRRGFLRATARRSLGTSALLTGASWFDALALREARASDAGRAAEGLARAAGSVASGSLGSLGPAVDSASGRPLLEMPMGFSYTSFGWTRDPMGEAAATEQTPPGHDGMGCFRASGATDDAWLLVRNHELGAGRLSSAAPLYDPAAGGGTTTLRFDGRARRLVETRPSLAGTLRNCAGGATPWGSWISAEETRDGPGDGPWTREHGFCFEVPAIGPASAEPLRSLGRFAHEALAFDREGRFAYLTEDADPAGLYRFRLERPRDLSSGTLEMLRVRDAPGFDARGGQRASRAMAIDWVPIEHPSPPGDRAQVNANGPAQQGLALGAARFRRLEGITIARGRVVFVSTTGGAAGLGQVWELDPESSQLRLVYESSAASALEKPDNLAVSPRGGVVVCEDGPGENRLLGLDATGRPFPVVRGNVSLDGERGFRGDFRSSELAGACWSADGRWLFFNVQQPGITFAMTGPWERLGL